MHPSLRRTSAITLRHLYLMRGSFARILSLFIWVALDIVLWGFISTWLNRMAKPEFSFIPAFLGAILLWDFFSRVMQGVTTAFFEDVWSRNFLNIFASPLTIGNYLGGLVLSSCITSAVGLAVMLTLATACFGLSLFDYGLLLAPMIFTLFLFGIALGIMGAGIVLRFGPASEWFIWPIPAMLAPFVGVFYPLSTLPGWMHAVSYLLAPSYVFENIRLYLSTGHADGAMLLSGLGLSILCIPLACWYFVRIYRYALKTGLIARYSAESVG